MISNKKLNQLLTELHIRGRKPNICTFHFYFTGEEIQLSIQTQVMEHTKFT